MGTITKRLLALGKTIISYERNGDQWDDVCAKERNQPEVRVARNKMICSHAKA